MKGVRVGLNTTWEVRTDFGDLGQLAAFLESCTLHFKENDGQTWDMF